MRRGRRGPLRTVLTVALVLVAANIAWHMAIGWVSPVMWLIVVAAVIVLVSKNAHRHGR
jgi:hypothetical protein